MDFAEWRKSLTTEQVDAILQHVFNLSLVISQPRSTDRTKIMAKIEMLHNDFAQISTRLNELRQQYAATADTNVLSVIDKINNLEKEVKQLKNTDVHELLSNVQNILDKLNTLSSDIDESKIIQPLQNLVNTIKLNSNSSENSITDIKRDILVLHKSIIDIRETILKCDSGKQIVELLTGVMQTQKNQDISDIKSILENMNKRERNPNVRGIQGENYVFDIFSSKYEVEDMRKKGKAGDYIVQIPQAGKITRKILVECKNHTNIVRQDEVDKFYRDIKEVNPHAGIFISINAKTAGIENDMHFDQVMLGEKQYPVLFISNRNGDLPLNVLRFMIECGMTIITGNLQHYDNINTINSRKEDYQIDSINKSLQELTNCIKIMENLRSNIDKYKINSNTFIDKLYENLLSLEMKITQHIEDIRRSMCVIEKNEYIINAETPENIAKMVGEKYKTPLIDIVKEIIYAFHTKIRKNIDWIFDDAGISCAMLSMKMLKTHIIVIFHMDLKSEKWFNIFKMHGGNIDIKSTDCIVKVTKKNKDIVFNIIENAF